MPTITATTTLKAIAVKSDMVDSMVMTAAYTISVVATPTANPASGEIMSGNTVTLTTTNGASIYYTTDNSIPSATNGTLYSDTNKPVITAATSNLKAIALNAGMIDSSVMNTSYTAIIVNAKTPNITKQPDSKSYDLGDTATAITITASASDGGTLSYKWYNPSTNTASGGTQVSTAVSYTPPVAALGTNFYYVEITNTNNNVNGAKTATVKSNVVAIDIFAKFADQHKVSTIPGLQQTYVRSVTVDNAGILYVSYGDSIVKINGTTITTLAGDSGGYADGTGTAAKFQNPEGVAVDSNGNVYVADYGNHRIRKISPAGVVTTLAGGTNGYADGTGTAAQFSNPCDVAVDSAGYVYVGEMNSHRVRKISPAGVVTTLAGGTNGYADGTGTAARFTIPYGVAVDGAGNVYVGDQNNNRIRKISPAGVVTTLAGSGTAGSADGTGTAAQFRSPRGVAVDIAGCVYVADNENNRIRKISRAGVVTTLAGSGTAGSADGTGTAAQFSGPFAVTVDKSGNVYVADTGNGKIRKITP
jgi:sugar lactone lactonase YvrE